MSPEPLSTDQILTILSTSPPRLAQLAAGLTEQALQTPPEPEAWSARDILAHLKACSDMWGEAMLRMINEDQPLMQVTNPRTWIKHTDYLQQEFQPLLQAFTAQRTALLSVLQALPPEGWLRTGMAQVWGQVVPRQVLKRADGMARHERSHVSQIERLLKQMPAGGRTAPARHVQAYLSEKESA